MLKNHTSTASSHALWNTLIFRESRRQSNKHVPKLLGILGKIFRLLLTDWKMSSSKDRLVVSELKYFITPCSALSFISRQKSHHSRFFELSVALSKFQNLHVMYVPGRFLWRVDALSRQWNNVFLHLSSLIHKRKIQQTDIATASIIPHP